MRSPIASGLLFFVAMAAVVSCTAPQEQAADVQEVPGPAAKRPDFLPVTDWQEVMAQHRAQNKQLVALMRDVSARTATAQLDTNLLHPRPPDGAWDGDRPFDTAIELAVSLESFGERVPASVAHVPMGAADRAGFHAAAEALRRQASGLGEAARARDPDRMRDSVDRISTTCVSCHRDYRDMLWSASPR